MLEIEQEKKSGLEKERLIALSIFGLVLFPWQTGVVNLEAAAAYVEYENTQINQVAAILAETIFFFGKLTYVLKEEDTNIIRGIPQIYNDNRNIKQQMATC